MPHADTGRCKSLHTITRLHQPTVYTSTSHVHSHRQSTYNNNNSRVLAVQVDIEARAGNPELSICQCPCGYRRYKSLYTYKNSRAGCADVEARAALEM
jgi:hypothetical protein